MGRLNDMIVICVGFLPIIVTRIIFYVQKISKTPESAGKKSIARGTQH
jgi:hypothetical protein